MILEARENVSCVRYAPLGEIAFFDGKEAHRWLIEAKETFTVPEVAATLRCPAAVMEAVMELGLLKFAANDPVANRVFRRVSKDAVQAFRQKLSGLMRLPSPDDAMVSLSQASALCHCTVAEIISLLFDGKLSRAAQTDGEIGLDIVFVDPTEISPLVELQDSVGLLDVKALERRLRTTTATVCELLKRDLLPFVVRRHRTTRIKQRFVEPEAVQEFLGKYISLSTIARESGQQIAVLKDHLDKRGVRPIFEPTGKIARFYPKIEIQRLGMI